MRFHYTLAEFRPQHFRCTLPLTLFPHSWILQIQQKFMNFADPAKFMNSVDPAKFMNFADPAKFMNFADLIH